MGIMSDWFNDTAESRRMLAEEHVILAASELVAEALETRGENRTWLAEKLGVKLAEVSQRLSGRRNLTLKSFAGMLHELGFGLEFRLVDQTTGSSKSVYHAAREMDWPIGNMRYTQTQTPIRLIKGGAAA
jgi:plasmid maintenance system antidote protein VapI